MSLARTLIAANLAVLAVTAAPASAANFIRNGSFEAGALGNGIVPEWTKSNTPTGALGQGDDRASVIGYNRPSTAYPTGAFGEAVTADNSVSFSPDAVGTKAAYFVGDRSVNETWSQLGYVRAGNYRIGFSYYLTQNGLNNRFNSSLAATILGNKVAMTMIDNSSVGRQWFNVSGVANFALSGHYMTDLVYNSNGYPAKDIVVDRVYAVRTNDPASFFIPPSPTVVPEPQSWALLIIGFGLIGVSARRKKAVVAA